MCFGALQIDCSGGYLDSRPKIRLAGDGSPKAAGRAKQLMKNLPRDGCRKSRGEDFDLQLSAGSASLQSIPTGSTASCAFSMNIILHKPAKNLFSIASTGFIARQPDLQARH